jgi:hypothetical protein
MWDWRIHDAKPFQDTFNYKPNTATYVRLIEFAGENDVPYLVIDAQWYVFVCVSLNK